MLVRCRRRGVAAAAGVAAASGVAGWGLRWACLLLRGGIHGASGDRDGCGEYVYPKLSYDEMNAANAEANAELETIFGSSLDVGLAEQHNRGVQPLPLDLKDTVDVEKSDTETRREYGVCVSGNADRADPAKLVDFLMIANRLKSLPRTGWLIHDVQRPESVGAHTFGVSLIAMLAAPASLDRDKCIRMALVHDLTETFVGDITPKDGVSKADKLEMERGALRILCGRLGRNSDAAREIEALWCEYEDAVTAEARFVRDMDRIDMLTTATTYENDNVHDELDLSEFFDSCTLDTFRTATGKCLSSQASKRRPHKHRPSKSSS